MGSGGKSGGKQQVIDYRLSVHYGVCVGPVDEVVAVSINEKDIGVSSLTGNAVVNLDNMSLFGGPKKGGGIRGQMHVLFGHSTQVLSSTLAAKLGRSPSTVSGFRNLLSIFFTGPAGTSDGFTWSSNLPSVPSTEITVRRAPKGLSGDALVGPDANPAHLVYECLTNTDWGAGYLVENIDVDSFLYAAQIFRNEAFGVSFLWTGSTAVEAFVNEVLQHVSANLVFDLATAKWILKPLRDDYDTTALREINPRNAEMVSFQRRSWGETINEVIVTWTNPDGEGEETVTQQDASGFAIQKTTVSDSSRNYPGLRSQSVAWRVAERDLRQAGTPLAAVELDLDLSERGLKPGDVLWFNWDELDEDGDVFLDPIVVRVLKVKEPKRGAASFRVSVLEDVFSYGVSRTVSQNSEFSDPDQQPVDVANVFVTDSPFFLVAQEKGDIAAQALDFPEGHMTVLSNSGLTDIRETELFSERPVPESDPEYLSVNSLDDVGLFETSNALVKEVVTTMALPVGHVTKSLSTGGFLLLENGAEQEICTVTGFSGTSVLLRRGCLDTVPKSWPSGTRAWEVSRSSRVVDPTSVLDGETVNYKLAPITSLGQLSLTDATAHAVTVSDRLHLPLRPANVRLDGQTGFAFSLSDDAASTTVKWANRNRISETYSILAWDDASTPGETGQTSRGELLRDGVVLASFTVSDETATETVLDLSNVTLEVGDELVLKVWSERAGLTSWTSVEMPVTVT